MSTSLTSQETGCKPHWHWQGASKGNEKKREKTNTIKGFQSLQVKSLKIRLHVIGSNYQN